jgi:hypothetical protein
MCGLGQCSDGVLLCALEGSTTDGENGTDGARQDRGGAEGTGGRGGEFRVIRVAPGFRVHGGSTADGENGTDGSGRCPLNSLERGIAVDGK